MVVDEDDSRGGELQSAFDHLAGIDRRVIDSAGLLDFVGDQAVALVEKQDAEDFAVLEGHCSAAIINDGRPGTKHLTLVDAAANELLDGGFDDFEIGRD